MKFSRNSSFAAGERLSPTGQKRLIFGRQVVFSFYTQNEPVLQAQAPPREWHGTQCDSEQEARIQCQPSMSYNSQHAAEPACTTKGLGTRRLLSRSNLDIICIDSTRFAADVVRIPTTMGKDRTTRSDQSSVGDPVPVRCCAKRLHGAIHGLDRRLARIRAMPALRGVRCIHVGFVDRFDAASVLPDAASTDRGRVRLAENRFWLPPWIDPPVGHVELHGALIRCRVSCGYVSGLAR